MPISFADTPETVDEERRLLYVGVTRAREFLNFSWSTARTPGGRANRRPSRFLDGLRPNSVGGGPAGQRQTAARKPRKTAAPSVCRVCGKVLTTGAERKLGRCSTCPAGYDEAVFEELRAWRLKEAASAEVPAFVVFTDATLMAIAEAAPEDLQALSALPGVGPSKLERYGEAVLAIVSSA
jgi:DNA helicase-2/ATP-dependent DNA helicase PcrA